MQINPTNKYLPTQNQPNFRALRSVKICHNRRAEKLIEEQFCKFAKRSLFIKENSTNAFITACCGVARLELKYKPETKNSIDKFFSTFKREQKVEFAEMNRCTDEAAYYLAKKIQKMQDSDIMNKINQDRGNF